MTAASARLHVSRSIASVAASLALLIAIRPPLDAQFAIGGSASVHVPPPRKTAAMPVKPQPERAAAEDKRLVETLNRMTPKQRKQLAKAVKHMTPEQRRRLGEILNRQSAASGAVPNRIKTAR
jgi:hypothetical protein